MILRHNNGRVCGSATLLNRREKILGEMVSDYEFRYGGDCDEAFSKLYTMTCNFVAKVRKGLLAANYRELAWYSHNEIFDFVEAICVLIETADYGLDVITQILGQRFDSVEDE